MRAAKVAAVIESRTFRRWDRHYRAKKGFLYAKKNYELRPRNDSARSGLFLLCMARASKI